MIPKIIHYCWFGRGKMPELAEHCLASWRKFLPDYELKLWNEDSFDVNQLRFTRQVFGLSIFARFTIRSSGTVMTPTLGSIVQKGKFAACALAFDRQLNSVDLPTLGRPTIPHCNAIVRSVSVFW